MKTPTAVKLPSGAWRVRIMLNGQKVSITKPTKKEAETEALAIKSGAVKLKLNSKHITLLQAIDNYIEQNRAVLSPSTLKAYQSYKRNRMQAAMPRDISTISDAQWQKFIDAELDEVSPKTVSNVWRLVSPSIRLATGHEPAVRLAKVPKNKRPYLAPAQIKTFIKAIHGTNIEIPALLVLSSLRSSELMDLQWKDIDFQSNTAHVNGAAVFDEHNVLVHKKLNKTDKSNRKIPLVPPLRTALLEAVKDPHKPEDYIVDVYDQTIYNRINAACKSAGLPRIGRHGLRHSFASLCFALGIEAEITMEMGGWSDLDTMRNIYTHIESDMIDTRAKRFTSFFNDTDDEPG